MFLKNTYNQQRIYLMIDKNKKILVLGSYGRIGKPVVELLEKSGYPNILFPTHSNCDLLDRYSYESYFHTEKPEYVINLAGKITNINLCQQNPATICGHTLQMNMAVLEMCRKYEVQKLANVLCSCAYPSDKSELREDEFWDGNPHQSVLAHGLAKRTCYFLSGAYAKQYHMNIVTVALNNIVGGADWSRPTSQKFLDSLIVKIVDAKKFNLKTVTLWGSGLPRREILYYRDAAEGVLQVFEKYDSPELINIGTGHDRAITEWANLVKNIARYKGEFIYDPTKPDGQAKKLFNVNKMRCTLEWKPAISDEEAISETIKEYKEYIKGVERRSYPLI